MSPGRNSFEVFTLGDGVEGTPAHLSPTTFAALGALEVQDIERWIQDYPTLRDALEAARLAG